MNIITSFAIGILSLIMLLVLIKKEILLEIGQLYKDIPKFAKITLFIVIAILLLFLIVYEAKPYFK